MNTQTIQRTTDKNKTHINKDMSFTSLLATYQPATQAELTHNALAGLNELLTYDLITPDSILYVDTNFTIMHGMHKGEIVPAGQTALVLHNNQNEPISLACYGLEPKPLITDDSQPCAFVLGDLSNDNQTWCMDNLEHGIKLYKAFYEHGIDVNVLVSINRYHFKDMVKHFAEVRNINLTTTLDNKEKLTSQLAGINCEAAITELIPLHECIEYDQDITELLTDSTTHTIDLRLLGWGEPESLSTEPSEPTPYPIEAWGDENALLRRVIEKIAYYAQVPHAMAGQCVLGALAHMGQRFVNAPMGNLSIPTSLILITEGDSGSGKSSAMKLSHFEINNWEREQYLVFKELLDRWNKDKAILNGKELKEFLATEPMPINKQNLYKDSTIEPILDKYVTGEIINASLTTDEAGQFFGGYTMKGDTASNAMGAITQLYDDGIVNRVRSQKGANANPYTQAHDVRFTLFLMGQRVILEPALTDPVMNGQGILARGLLACPTSLQGCRTWNDPQRRQQSPYTEPVLQTYWDRCKTLLDPVASNNPDINAEGKPNRFNMSWQDMHTEQVFYDCYQVIEQRQGKGGIYEHLKSYASRMAENASRIATLMAYFDNRTSITTDDITRAFMLVEYSTAERLRYLDAGTSEQSDSEKLISWLVSKAKGKTPPILNRTVVYHGCPKPMLKNNKLLQTELDNLENMGHIRQEMNGRKKIIFINPNLCK